MKNKRLSFCIVIIVEYCIDRSEVFLVLFCSVLIGKYLSTLIFVETIEGYWL